VNVFSRIIDFVLFSNLFLALSVTSLVFETDGVLHRPYSGLSYPFFLFFSTLFLYCFHRIYNSGRLSASEKIPTRHLWVRNNPNLFLIILSASATGTLICIFLFIPLRVTCSLIPIGLISLGYTIPCIPWKGKRIRLRDIPGIKILLISVVLGLTTVLLPVMTYSGPGTLLEPGVIFIFIRRVFFIFAITVPFDIRDMEFDEKQNTLTIPLMIGIKHSVILALIALGGFVLLALAQYFFFHNLSPGSLTALTLSALAAAVIIRLTDKPRSDYFYSFFLEGTMMLQCLLMIAANIFWK
jgi:4-hydroxybenzoate polyprenyltransferase